MLEITCGVYYFKQSRESVFKFNDHNSLFFMQLHTVHVKQNKIFTISKLFTLNHQSYCVILSTKKQKYFLVFC
ncbi:hypothetical protein CN558_26515 [Bacillus wiedmannii]|nr:hypothetical protein CN627_28640 [Bacillus wiedmannii]PEO80737.1 hypothetical protein CN558_26515 [Bacillus wiedmannii]PEQ03436.1 hypothetical protein CN587_17920 [Bacillus wiedmannii]PGE32883.1 hypothetical protein COM52_11100 [Bacillus wiedmannii]PHA34107.1 hypothetical protein COF06_24845 [Bacillus wiedmannii]